MIIELTDAELAALTMLLHTNLSVTIQGDASGACLARLARFQSLRCRLRERFDELCPQPEESLDACADPTC